MLRNKWISLPVILLAFAVFANAGPIVNVYATLGPSPAGASYSAFVANVVTAMQSANPMLSVGTGAATYNPINTITPNQPIESIFQSWQGTAPGPYAGEFGTDLYFALHIKDAAGATFSLSMLSWYGTSPSAPDDPYSYVADTYESHRRGYNGATEYSAGEAGTNPVDELIYVGVSNYYPISVYTGDNQADLNVIRDGLAAFVGQYITGKYTLAVPNLVNQGFTFYSDQEDVRFDGGDIPEPGTIALAALGFAAVLFARRGR